jgi:hypothetical protein
MFEGQSQRSIALSAQHRQEAEVAAAEERERATAETAATAARLAMVELAAAAAAELKALRASSTDSSVSADDDRDIELKLAREATREQVAQWAAAHPQGRRGGSRDRRRRCSGRGRAQRPCPRRQRQPRQAWTCRRTGTMVTMGSRPLSGTSVPAAGGLPSPRPTTSSGPQLITTVSSEMQFSLSKKRTAKEAWDAITAARIGSDCTRKTTLQALPSAAGSAHPADCSGAAAQSVDLQV